MLKDITLGQFFPGNTIVHRLDPRTKLMAVILYIVALFNAKSPLTYALVAAVLAVCIVASRVPLLCCEADIGEHLLATVIGKCNVVKYDIITLVRQCLCTSLLFV